jgi:predicted Zn-dependent peptidase
MKTFLIGAFLSLFMVGTAVGSAAGQTAAETPRHPDALTLGELDFSLPEGVETRLSNGIRVFIFEDHDLPLVTLAAYISMGSRYLPPNRHTAFSIYSRLWDEGGAGERSPEEVEEQVAALGMFLSAGASRMMGSVNASMVREDLSAGAELWRDLLLHPRFDTERLDRAKAQLLKDVQGINDDPDRLAGTWFPRLLSGPDSPEGRVHTREGIDAVSREEILALYHGFVRPERSIIGVSGDVVPDEITALLEDLLDGWRGVDEAIDLTPYPWERATRSGVFLLPGDFQQCHIRMGRSVDGLTNLSDDYAHSKLLDFGFGYMRVYYRTREEGLSYGTGTRLVADEDRAKFYAHGSTRTDKVINLIGVVRDEAANLPERPLNADESESARIFMVGVKVQDLETARAVMRTRLGDIIRGRPQDYTERLVAGMQSATTADLAAAAARYTGFGDDTVVLVVGEPEGGAAALEALGLGPVTVLEPVVFGQ